MSKPHLISLSLTPPPMSHVVVAGAGVIGLSIAHQLLLQNSKIQKVTIIAKDFPHDLLTCEYTSPWAGAHFRPYPHKPESWENDAREANYTRVTQQFFEKFAALNPDSTIKFSKGTDFLEAPSKEYLELGSGYNADSLKEFKVLEKLPDGVKFGAEYLTFCLDAPEYLKFLQNAIEQLCKLQNIQLQFVKLTLPSLKYIKELYPDVSLIFNATANGLQYNGSYDPACFKIRGQTLLLNVTQPTPYNRKTITHQSKDGHWTFVIRRSATHYILGGTKQPGDDYPLPRESDTVKILSRASKVFPDLDTSDIIRVNVGFRPARRGGSRVDKSLHEGLPVVHAYGLGGSGFETSVGVAKHALELAGLGRLESKL
ncbi:hypothetical protein ZYGR_0AD06720 [Zygosaccharomyces rouxii]|uniref:FAD dependent oxidoreductase domain-containing protein n=1 Tax=Zygosaccharomyces rouxii TaxID=4956 RepID=A0A1Q3A6Z1_ZYGRO|nr:hypothetical protein ZYGR_0AD06720 [Zygosaccharomyces rouxii]